MIIYFINRESKLQGPFDVMNAHSKKILRIGDICIRDTSKGLQFLWVISNVNKWNSCICIGVSRDAKHDITANTLLFSFDGIHKRTGNASLLRILDNAFSNELLHRFFMNALDILSYKCDSWDIQLFIEFNSLKPTPSTDIYTKRPIPQGLKFIDYFDSTMKEMFYKLQSENIKTKEIFLRIRELKPKEFRKALKQFIAENPASNIYDID